MPVEKPSTSLGYEQFAQQALAYQEDQYNRLVSDYNASLARSQRAAEIKSRVLRAQPEIYGRTILSRKAKAARGDLGITSAGMNAELQSTANWINQSLSMIEQRASVEEKERVRKQIEGMSWEERYKIGDPSITLFQQYDATFFLKDTGQRYGGQPVYQTTSGRKFVGKPNLGKYYGLTGVQAANMYGTEIVNDKVVVSKPVGSRQAGYVDEVREVGPANVSTVTIPGLETPESWSEQYVPVYSGFRFSPGQSPSSKRTATANKDLIRSTGSNVVPSGRYTAAGMPIYASVGDLPEYKGASASDVAYARAVGLSPQEFKAESKFKAKTGYWPTQAKAYGMDVGYMYGLSNADLANIFIGTEPGQSFEVSRKNLLLSELNTSGLPKRAESLFYGREAQALPMKQAPMATSSLSAVRGYGADDTIRLFGAVGTMFNYPVPKKQKVVVDVGPAPGVYSSGFGTVELIDFAMPSFAPGLKEKTSEAYLREYRGSAGDVVRQLQEEKKQDLTDAARVKEIVYGSAAGKLNMFEEQIKSSKMSKRQQEKVLVDLYSNFSAASMADFMSIEKPSVDRQKQFEMLTGKADLLSRKQVNGMSLSETGRKLGVLQEQLLKDEAEYLKARGALPAKYTSADLKEVDDKLQKYNLSVNEYMGLQPEYVKIAESLNQAITEMKNYSDVYGYDEAKYVALNKRAEKIVELQKEFTDLTPSVLAPIPLYPAGVDVRLDKANKQIEKINKVKLLIASPIVTTRYWNVPANLKKQDLLKQLVGEYEALQDRNIVPTQVKLSGDQKLMLDILGYGKNIPTADELAESGWSFPVAKRFFGDALSEIAYGQQRIVKGGFSVLESIGVSGRANAKEQKGKGWAFKPSSTVLGASMFLTFLNPEKRLRLSGYREQAKAMESLYSEPVSTGLPFPSDTSLFLTKESIKRNYPSIGKELYYDVKGLGELPSRKYERMSKAKPIASMKEFSASLLKDPGQRGALALYALPVSIEASGLKSFSTLGLGMMTPLGGAVSGATESTAIVTGEAGAESLMNAYESVSGKMLDERERLYYKAVGGTVANVGSYALPYRAEAAILGLSPEVIAKEPGKVVLMVGLGAGFKAAGAKYTQAKYNYLTSPKFKDLFLTSKAKAGAVRFGLDVPSVALPLAFAGAYVADIETRIRGVQTKKQSRELAKSVGREFAYLSLGSKVVTARPISSRFKNPVAQWEMQGLANKELFENVPDFAGGFKTRYFVEKPAVSAYKYAKRMGFIEKPEVLSERWVLETFHLRKPRVSAEGRKYINLFEKEGYVKLDDKGMINNFMMGLRQDKYRPVVVKMMKKYGKSYITGSKVGGENIPTFRNTRMSDYDWVFYGSRANYNKAKASLSANLRGKFGKIKTFTESKDMFKIFVKRPNIKTREWYKDIFNVRYVKKKPILIEKEGIRYEKPTSWIESQYTILREFESGKDTKVTEAKYEKALKSVKDYEARKMIFTEKGYKMMFERLDQFNKKYQKMYPEKSFAPGYKVDAKDIEVFKKNPKVWQAFLRSMRSSDVLSGSAIRGEYISQAIKAKRNVPTFNDADIYSKNPQSYLMKVRRYLVRTTRLKEKVGEGDLAANEFRIFKSQDGYEVQFSTGKVHVIDIGKVSQNLYSVSEGGWKSAFKGVVQKSKEKSFMVADYGLQAKRELYGTFADTRATKDLLKFVTGQRAIAEERFNVYKGKGKKAGEWDIFYQEFNKMNKELLPKSKSVLRMNLLQRGEGLKKLPEMMRILENAGAKKLAVVPLKKAKLKQPFFNYGQQDKLLKESERRYKGSLSEERGFYVTPYKLFDAKSAYKVNGKYNPLEGYKPYNVDYGLYDLYKPYPIGGGGYKPYKPYEEKYEPYQPYTPYTPYQAYTPYIPYNPYKPYPEVPKTPPVLMGFGYGGGQRPKSRDRLKYGEKVFRILELQKGVMKRQNGFSFL